jgi:hypothetical protein
VTGGSNATRVRTFSGLGGGQLEADQAGDAVGEHVGRPGADRGQDPLGVVGVDLDQLVGGRPVELAAGHAPRVVGHHRPAGGEPPGQDRVEPGVGRHPGNDQQQGPVPPDLVVEARPRDLQGGDPGPVHRPHPPLLAAGRAVEDGAEEGPELVVVEGGGVAGSQLDGALAR